MDEKEFIDNWLGKTLESKKDETVVAIKGENGQWTRVEGVDVKEYWAFFGKDGKLKLNGPPCSTMQFEGKSYGLLHVIYAGNGVVHYEFKLNDKPEGRFGYDIQDVSISANLTKQDLLDLGKAKLYYSYDSFAMLPDIKPRDING